MENKEYIDLCKALGCFKAALIDTAAIPFDKDMRMYCEMNSCGRYGANYACPPLCGEPDKCMAKAKSYKRALVFQNVTKL
ncbi:MAG TPA: DUF2284 domain-containing protein, partial [Bacillota bacterium]|nr:DUF2284 domain-containing protein [Bacillota bacterium]